MRGKQPPPKVEETEAESESPSEQSGTRSHKTRAEKDKHNARCRQSRLNIKEKRKTLEEAVPKLQAENKKMKMNLEEVQSKFREKETEIQQLKRNLEAKKASDERIELMSRRILPRLKVNGQGFTSFDELGIWLASQDYVQDCQVSGTSGNVLYGGNEFAGLGPIGDNLPLSINQQSFSSFDELGKLLASQDYVQDCLVSGTSGNVLRGGNEFEGLGPIGDNLPLSINQDFPFLSHTPDQGYTSTTASAALGSFSVANHGLPTVYDAPTSHHGPVNTNITVSAVAGSSSVANHGLPIVYEAPTSHHGPVNTNVTVSAVAGSSSVARHGMPIESDTPTSQQGQEHTNITASAAVSFLSDGVPTVPGSSLGANPETVFDQTSIPEYSNNLPTWFEDDLDYHNLISFLDTDYHCSLYGDDPKGQH